MLVAISIAVEEFFHYGDRWRHYRQTVGWLKNEGWHYFQLSGRCRSYDNHDDAYPAFAARVEDLIQQDAEVYITEVVDNEAEDKKKS